jgi:nitroreductase
LLSQLKWRYATKQFDPTRKIDPATWAALEEVLILSPSSFGLQPWKFYVITDQETKEKLVPLSWGQRQLAKASHVVVFAVRHPIEATDVRRHIERTAEVQGRSVEELAGFENVVNDFLENPPDSLDIRAWATRQVYIALGSFMTSAALLGVDTCPMEGLDPAGYDELSAWKEVVSGQSRRVPLDIVRRRTSIPLFPKCVSRKNILSPICHESGS